MACVAFLSRGALGLLIAARGDFPFAQCSCQKLVLSRRCDRASALSVRAGSGGMAAAWAQKAFARPILLPRQGEHVAIGFRAPETPSKDTGPREPGAAPPRFALWRAKGLGQKMLALLSSAEARLGCCFLPEETFPLHKAAARSSFWAVGATGPRR